VITLLSIRQEGTMSNEDSSTRGAEPPAADGQQYDRLSFLRKGAGAGVGLVAGGTLLGSASQAAAARTKWTGIGRVSKTYHWRMGTVVALDDPFTVYLQNMAALIKKNTNGAVTVDIFPNGVLGSELDTFHLMQSGAIPFQPISTATVNSTIPSTALYTLPYLFDTTKPLEMRKIYTGSTADFQRHEMRRFGVRILDFVNNGTRHLGGKKAFGVPADLSGVKVRVPNTPLWISTWKAFGAVPTPLAFTDTYSALQQGLVSAYEIPLRSIESTKWYEQGEFVSLIGWTITPVFVGVNAKVWGGLPKALREGIARAVQVAGTTFDGAGTQRDAAARAALAAKGVTLQSVNIKAWKAKATPVWGQFESQVGGIDLVNRVLHGKH